MVAPSGAGFRDSDFLLGAGIATAADDVTAVAQSVAAPDELETLKSVTENFQEFCDNRFNGRTEESITDSELTEAYQDFIKQAKTRLDPKMKKILKKMLTKHMPMIFKFMITGSTGIGKSSFLNFLLGTDFVVSDFLRGTQFNQIKHSKIGFLDIEARDTVGLGDEG